MSAIEAPQVADHGKQLILPVSLRIPSCKRPCILGTQPGRGGRRFGPRRLPPPAAAHGRERRPTATGVVAAHSVASAQDGGGQIGAHVQVRDWKLERHIQLVAQRLQTGLAKITKGV